MKRLVKLLSLAFVFFAFAANAQDIYIGPKVGVNYVTVAAPLSNELGVDNLLTADFGAMAEFEFGDMFSLQGELMYARKGFSITQNFDIPINESLTIPAGLKVLNNSNYLELPVMAKIRFNGDKRLETYLLGGASVGYLMSNRIRTQADLIVNLTVIDTKIPLNDINRADFSLIGGAGFAAKLPVGKFYMDLRYRHGLSELVNIPLLTDKVQNRGLLVSAGYAINF